MLQRGVTLRKTFLIQLVVPAGFVVLAFFGVVTAEQSIFVQFIDVNAKTPGLAFFILALTLEIISFIYMSFLIVSGSFVTRYVKTKKKLAKIGNSLIGLVFVGFAARLATLQS